MSSEQGTGRAPRDSHGKQDALAVAELRETIEELLTWLRAGTFDEEPGEADARDRALAVLARYKPASDHVDRVLKLQAQAIR